MIPLIVTAAFGGAFLSHSAETLDSLYSHYSVPGTELLRENYLYDTAYRADYLGTDDGNPEYMLLFVRNLDHAWHRMRDPASKFLSRQ